MHSATRMLRFLSNRWGLVASAVTLGLALASCSDRITTVDPSYTSPEGNLSDDAQLLVWAEEPITVTHYTDRGSGALGPRRLVQCPERLEIDPVDLEVRSEPFRQYPSGSIRSVILDRTPATRYSLMRRELNGGFRKLLDYPLRPARRWLESGWEMYDFTDTAPSGFEPATYVGRGIVGESSSQDSPLTNQGEAGAPLADITFNAPCLPCDSTFRLSWTPVPGAYRYWVHVYQFLIAPTTQQLLLASMPAPLNLVLPRDILIATMDSTVTSFRMRGSRFYEQPVPEGVRILTERGALFGQTYNVRITALNRQGRLIAISRGDYAQLAVPSGYGMHRMHAYLVTPQRPRIGPPFCQP